MFRSSCEQMADIIMWWPAALDRPSGTIFSLWYLLQTDMRSCSLSVCPHYELHSVITKVASNMYFSGLILDDDCMSEIMWVLSVPDV